MRTLPPFPDLRALDETRLAEWLAERRWFGAKSRELAQVHVLDQIVLHDGPPGLAVAVVEARFPGGTHDLYQLLLAARPASESWEASVVEEVGGQTIYDALADPEAIAGLSAMLRGRTSVGDGYASVCVWLCQQPTSSSPRASASRPARRRSRESTV